MRGRGGAHHPPFDRLLAGVAQLAEQLICNQQVAGSSPIASSRSGAQSFGNAKTKVDRSTIGQHGSRHNEQIETKQIGLAERKKQQSDIRHSHPKAETLGLRVGRAENRTAARMGVSLCVFGCSTSFDELERYRSGQTGQTVNLLAQPSEVRILPSPPIRRAPGSRASSSKLRAAAVTGGARSCRSFGDSEIREHEIWKRCSTEARGRE